jgi:hypothetical protein
LHSYTHGRICLGIVEEFEGLAALSRSGHRIGVGVGLRVELDIEVFWKDFVEFELG